MGWARRARAQWKFTEIAFTLEGGDSRSSSSIKISKGEESIFVWSIFHCLLDQVVSVLSEPEESERETDQFNNLEYIFIDDPVTSLDENHLIELAVELASLIKSSPKGLKYIVATHSPLFYKVLHSELDKPKSYMLNAFEDGTFALDEKMGSSNRNFSYHLHLRHLLEEAIASSRVERFHFTLLRNLYEKTASFLGHQKWQDLLPGQDKDQRNPYYKRIVNFSSHDTLSAESVAAPTPQKKRWLNFSSTI